MLAILIFLAMQGAVADTALSEAPIADIRILPRDVARFSARRDECEHWGGEEPYDKARRAEIEQAIRDLRCTSLRKDEQRLRKRYQKHPDILKTITESDV